MAFPSYMQVYLTPRERRGVFPPRVQQCPEGERIEMTKAERHVAAAILVCVLTGMTSATVLTVDDDDPCADYSTIQAAINNSFDSDTIIVMPGTYVENINMSGKAITLRSSDPTDGTVVLATIIDGGGSGSAITCSSGEDPNTVIEGFMVRNGNKIFGGGMYNVHSSPTVSNCTFSESIARYGGGMGNLDNSSPTVANCTFSANVAAQWGGGMLNWGSSPAVRNCTFSGNTISSEGGGGGMGNMDDSSPSVTNCTFSGNTISSEGGGGMSNDDSSPVVCNCNFIGNVAFMGGGGGMSNDDSSPTVSNCTFSGNTGFGGGGCIIALRRQR